MRKTLYVLGTLVGLALFFIAIFRVEERQVEGFVGPDILWESDSFYAVYDIQSGELLQNVGIEPEVCPDPFGGLCTDMHGATYFGYQPIVGDHVRVQIYGIWYRWFDKEHWGENFSLVFVNQLPKVEHVQAIVPQFTFSVTVETAEPEPVNQDLVGKTMYISRELADVQNPSMEYLGEPTYVPGEPVEVLSVTTDGEILTVRFQDGREDSLNIYWLSEWKLAHFFHWSLK